MGKMINIGIWEADDFEQRQVVGVAAARSTDCHRC